MKITETNPRAIAAQILKHLGVDPTTANAESVFLTRAGDLNEFDLADCGLDDADEGKRFRAWLDWLAYAAEDVIESASHARDQGYYGDEQAGRDARRESAYCRRCLNKINPAR